MNTLKTESSLLAASRFKGISPSNDISPEYRIAPERRACRIAYASKRVLLTKAAIWLRRNAGCDDQGPWRKQIRGHPLRTYAKKTTQHQGGCSCVLACLHVPPPTAPHVFHLLFPASFSSSSVSCSVSGMNISLSSSSVGKGSSMWRMKLCLSLSLLGQYGFET